MVHRTGGGSLSRTPSPRPPTVSGGESGGDDSPCTRPGPHLVSTNFCIRTTHPHTSVQHINSVHLQVLDLQHTFAPHIYRCLTYSIPAQHSCITHIALNTNTHADRCLTYSIPALHTCITHLNYTSTGPAAHLHTTFALHMYRPCSTPVQHTCCSAIHPCRQYPIRNL